MKVQRPNVLILCLVLLLAAVAVLLFFLYGAVPRPTLPGGDSAPGLPSAGPHRPLASTNAGPGPSTANTPDISAGAPASSTPAAAALPVTTIEEEAAERFVMPLRGGPVAASFAAQANEILARVATNSASAIAAMANKLRASESPRMQALGVLMEFNANGGKFDDALADKLFGLKNQATILTVAAWLQDNGFGTSAQGVLQAWKGKGFNAGLVAELLTGGELEAGAARYAIPLVTEGLAKDDARNVLEQVVRAATENSAVRLAAALYLRDTMSFEEYQQVILAMSRSAGKSQGPKATAPLPVGARIPPANQQESPDLGIWQDSIRRLASQVNGPVDLMSGPVVITPDDIEVMFENLNCATLGMTAIQLEYALAHSDSLIGKGTAQKLRDYLAPIKKDELSDDDIMCLKRIEISLGRLPGVERTDVRKKPYEMR